MNENFLILERNLMKMTIRNMSVALSTAITSLTLLSQPAFADCTRHVYNKSENVWSFGFTATAEEKLGDDATIIANGETAVIEHITGGAKPKWLRLEKVTYTDGKPHYKASFLMNGCYIQHNGRTDRAVLNDPADGDVIFID
ncbi:MAG: hypothetical protein ACI84R_000865 [Candidatus Azotimanducaceae bacterium]|jgi:hypothetical protein